MGRIQKLFDDTCDFMGKWYLRAVNGLISLVVEAVKTPTGRELVHDAAGLLTRADKILNE